MRAEKKKRMKDSCGFRWEKYSWWRRLEMGIRGEKVQKREEGKRKKGKRKEGKREKGKREEGKREKGKREEGK